MGETGDVGGGGGDELLLGGTCVPTSYLKVGANSIFASWNPEKARPARIWVAPPFLSAFRVLSNRPISF